MAKTVAESFSLQELHATLKAAKDPLFGDFAVSLGLAPWGTSGATACFMAMVFRAVAGYLGSAVTPYPACTADVVPLGGRQTKQKHTTQKLPTYLPTYLSRSQP